LKLNLLRVFVLLEILRGFLVRLKIFLDNFVQAKYSLIYFKNIKKDIFAIKIFQIVRLKKGI